MTATIHPQGTGTQPVRTGPLTVPSSIIRAAGARHRTAVIQHAALPVWALTSIAVTSAALIAFAVLNWRPVSPLLIVFVLIGTGCAYAPDLLPVRTAQTSAPAERIDA